MHHQNDFYFQTKEPEKIDGCVCIGVLIFILAILTGVTLLILWGIDEIFGIRANNEKLRLQEIHEHEEMLLEQQLIKKIYANQRLQMFESDGLQIKPFAQEILKLIGNLMISI